jgi:hypothetical protein
MIFIFLFFLFVKIFLIYKSNSNNKITYNVNDELSILSNV